MTAHPVGQWSKKHKGKVHYFGPWHDPDLALARWRRLWPIILEGGPLPSDDPEDAQGVSPTLHEAVRAWLKTKLSAHRRGELAWPTYRKYRSVCRSVLDCLGRQRTVDTLGPSDFLRLLSRWSVNSPQKRADDVVVVRSMVSWIGERYGATVRLGSEFRGPPMKQRRAQRRGRAGRFYSARQAQALVHAAAAHSDRLCAAVLMGLNAGFGQSDLAHLRREDVDLVTGWVDTVRHKTLADRRFKLWPETIAALERVVREDSELLLPGYRGQPAVRRGTDEFGSRFRRIRQAAGVGGGWYWFRYTFSTVASAVPDEHARRIVMGHAVDGVSEGYVLEFPEHRLVSLTDHVRAWYLTGTGRDRCYLSRRCASDCPPAASAWAAASRGAGSART